MLGITQYLLYQSKRVILIVPMRDMDKPEHYVQSFTSDVVEYHVHRKIAYVIARVVRLSPLPSEF